MLTFDLEKRLNQIGQQLTDRLRDDILNKPLTTFGSVSASGKLAASVRYEVSGGGLKVFALDYIFQIEFGRRPGKFPPLDALKDWVVIRNFAPDLPMSSRIFLAGRSIAQKGTTIFQQGGSNLIKDIADSDFFVNITKEMEAEFVKDITSEILGALR